MAAGLQGCCQWFPESRIVVDDDNACQHAILPRTLVAGLIYTNGAEQASVVVWEKICGAYHASITGVPGKVRFFLIVEELRGSCQWSVWRWRPGESVLDAGHGPARTPQEAMQLAERAAIENRLANGAERDAPSNIERPCMCSRFGPRPMPT